MLQKASQGGWLGLAFSLFGGGKQCLPGGLVVKKPPAKQETQETYIQSLSQEDPLEKEMATHSSILA